MGDLSANLSRKEFACSCGCGFDTADIELINILQDVRDHFNAPIHITSGCRCPQLNHEIGGAPRSQHLIGRAADFVVAGITTQELYAYLVMKWPGKYGFKRYSRWVHADSRSEEWRSA